MNNEMTNNFEPYDLEELLAGYVLGNLDETELAWLNTQLKTHPQLKAEIKKLEATLNLMPYELSESLPTSDLRQAIITKLEVRSTKKTPSLRLSWIIGVMAVLSTLYLGINNYGLRHKLALANHQLQTHQDLVNLLRQPNNRLVSFQGLGTLPDASGSLFIAPQQQKAVLALQNLKPLSGKQVYRLWAISSDKKTGCANFTPDSQGTVHIELSNEALTNAGFLLITVEPEADTLQPQGNEILKGYYTL